MQAIIDTTTRLVVFAFADDAKVQLTQSGLMSPLKSFDTTSDTHTLETVPDNPLFIGGCWRYTNAWVAVDTQRIDALAASVQAAAVQALQAAIIAAVQARLDAFASTRNYDSILSACTYATSKVPQFATEGQSAVNARDATWSTLYTILGEVQAGTRPVPTGFADVEPLLPVLSWPV